MAKKALIRGNYFILQDTQTNTEYEAHQKNCFVRRRLDTSEEFFFTGLNGFSDAVAVTINQDSENILDSDLIKEDDSPFTLSEWLTFYSENTGNFNSPQAGGDALEMGVITLEADTTPNSTITDVEIPSFTFTVPAGKYVKFEVIAPFTAGATTTGLGLVARLTTSVGANGNVVGAISTDSRLTASTIGRVSNKVDLGANATANYDSLSGVSTAGSTNNAIINGKLNNLATNTDATVTILFRSEVAGSAVVIEKGATLDWTTK